MKATARVQSPDKVNVTITITAPLEQWKQLREQLGAWKAAWPASDFQRVIGDVVTKVENTVLADSDTA